MTDFETSPGLPRGFAFAAGIKTPLVLRPVGLIAGAAGKAMAAAGTARLLAGGPVAFTACEVFLYGEGAVLTSTATLAQLEAWAEAEGGVAEALVPALMAGLSQPRPAFAGVSLERPRIVGIVNTSPNSFYAPSAFADAPSAIAHGHALVAAGADIVDVGGESSRPGAAPVPVEAELARVVPVVKALAASGATVSVDTRRTLVMEQAIAAGAVIVNDITALAGEAGSLKAVADAGVSVVLMHMQGGPDTMQDAPSYGHAACEIFRTLEARVAECEAAGIARANIAVDPGIGFGKTLAHNLQILDSMALFHGLGCVVMVGASRKSFIARIEQGIEQGFDPVTHPVTDPGGRLPGSLAAAVMAAGQGVQLHRVHDVAETRQALAVWRETAALG